MKNTNIHASKFDNSVNLMTFVWTSVACKEINIRQTPTWTKNTSLATCAAEYLDKPIEILLNCVAEIVLLFYSSSSGLTR